MPTIQLTINGDTPASVTLLDLKRSDTNEAVAGVGTPAAFSDEGDGVWSFTFAAPEEGLHYHYTCRLTWDDGTTTDLTGTLDDLSSQAAGRYVTQAFMEEVRGTANIREWSAKGDEAETDVRAVQAAIDAAESRIDAELGRMYWVPLTNLTDADALAVRLIAEPLASYNLYMQRGEPQEDDNVAGDLERARDEALALLVRYRRGELTLPSATRSRGNGSISVASRVFPAT